MVIRPGIPGRNRPDIRVGKVRRDDSIRSFMFEMAWRDERLGLIDWIGVELEVIMKEAMKTKMKTQCRRRTEKN